MSGPDGGDGPGPGDLTAFRGRARDWLAANLPRIDASYDGLATDEESIRRARRLQRTLFDGGFAGLCFPVEYGGQGLTFEHQQVFNEESLPYQMPLIFNMVTLSILAPTLLDFGTEAQKRTHVPAILRGEEIWCQFLSEPTSGSDLAGASTRATRDGDVWVLNGSKTWTTGAYRAEFGMCLARSDWDVPKHRGLTMFIVAVRQPGLEVRRIKQVDGNMEFCQEFFDDVTVRDSDVVGTVNDGWTVATRQLWHERNAVGGSTPYMSGVMPERGSGPPRLDLVELAGALGAGDDAYVRQLVAEAYVHDYLHPRMVERIMAGVRSGSMPEPSGALLKLFGATSAIRREEIALEVAGVAATVGAAASHDGDGPQAEGGAHSPVRLHPEDLAGRYGPRFLGRQARGLGGGSNEMQRNVISERVLGLPRAPSPDRDRPFRDVRRNTAPSREDRR